MLAHPDWDVTVCVGRDTDLDEMARAKAATAPERMEVIGHARRMPQLLRDHHVVISRAEAGIVQERGHELAFQHDLIREAVRGACAPSVRRALDRQAADVMLGRGALPVEVAIQLAASASPGDEVAITTLLGKRDAPHAHTSRTAV